MPDHRTRGKLRSLMTTIAVNRNMMVGDRQFTHSSGMKLIGKTKIYELPLPDVFDCKRAFIGFAGNADAFGKAISWLHDPTTKPPKLNGVEMLLLDQRGKIYHGTTMTNWMELSDSHFAIGSGMQFAQAAMASGKDPYEACKIAAKFDANTGCGYTKLVMK